MECKKIILFLFLLVSSFLHGQTQGLNYQAVILNTSEIEIPGTNVKENQVPLGLYKCCTRHFIRISDALNGVSDL